MSSDDVVILIVQLDKRDLEDEVQNVTSKLAVEAGIVDVVAFESFFLPLLEALIATVHERVTRYGTLFRMTLSKYAMRFVQVEPQAGN